MAKPTTTNSAACDAILKMSFVSVKEIEAEREQRRIQQESYLLEVSRDAMFDINNMQLLLFCRLGLWGWGVGLSSDFACLCFEQEKERI
jgi:hypothetical protein